MIARLVPFLILACASPAAVAAEPRQPTGKWVVDFGDSQCVAYRSYGTEEKPLYLTLKAPPLGNIIQVGVLRSGRTDKFAEQLDAQVVIDRRKPFRTSVLAFTAKAQKRRAYLVNLPIEEFAPMRSANLISIRAAGELNESFGISAIGPLMKVMDECVADLGKVWNVIQPGEVQIKLKQSASGNLQGVIKDSDYPAVAIAKSQSGAVTLALLIDETGSVADCTVIATSGAASLDAQSCALLKERAKFTPAIGMDNTPAKDSFIQRISWRVQPLGSR